MTAAVADPGDEDPELIRQAIAMSRNWAPQQKLGMLRAAQHAAQRDRVRTLYTDPVDMAVSINPLFTRTAPLDLIGRAAETVLQSRRPINLGVSMPPQEGKSTACAVWTPLRALQIRPNAKVVLATYAASLAETHSATCRNIIEQHGSDVVDPLTGAAVQDQLGYKLARGSNKISNWQIEGAEGGMVAVGVGGPITGRRADLLIIDDPFKNMMEADSETMRNKIWEWYQSVILSRLSPSGSVILIQTRWHPEDLIGKVMESEKALAPKHRTWKFLNIPAISETGIDDALNRPRPGIQMESARDEVTDDGDLIPRDFEAIHRRMGERTWYALYQGNPRNPAGGLFLRRWFEQRAEDPARAVAAVVAIDPADSGKGDECGIIGAKLAPDGTVVLVEDWSGHMTSDEWARQAVIMALTIGAREIAFEAYTTATTYAMVLKRAYRELHEAARLKYAAGAALTQVEQKCLSFDAPFTLHHWREPGDAVERSALLRQAYENGRARNVEVKMAVLESQACDWQSGQHCPDRVAAAVIAHHRMLRLAGGRMVAAPPLAGARGAVNSRQAPAWMRRSITSGQRGGGRVL